MKKITIILLCSIILLSSYAISDEKSNFEINDIVTSSNLKDKKDVYRYDESKLIDNDSNTCWVEGKKGSGIGEKITIKFSKVEIINELYILNGINSPKYYYLNNRVKILNINGYDIELDDAGINKIQTIILPKELKVKELTLKIVSVYKGKKWNDTCISEIGFDKDKFNNIVTLNNKSILKYSNKYKNLLGKWKGSLGEKNYISFYKSKDKNNNIIKGSFYLKMNMGCQCHPSLETYKYKGVVKGVSNSGIIIIKWYKNKLPSMGGIKHSTDISYLRMIGNSKIISVSNNYINFSKN